MMLNQYRRMWSGMLLSMGTLIVATAPGTEARARVYLRVGPPAPIVDARVIAPGPGYVWTPGSYTWDGSAYLWVHGRWELPPPAAGGLGARPLGAWASRMVCRRRPLEIEPHEQRSPWSRNG
jgi:YXWGXW repeat-containing protein